MYPFSIFIKAQLLSIMEKNTPKNTSPTVVSLKTRDGRDVNIPYEGSLGLLALGDVGLILWRNKKEENK